MIFVEHDTIDPLGVPVRLADRRKLKVLREHSRLRVEDRTSNYVRYREDKSGIRYGFFINEGE